MLNGATAVKKKTIIFLAIIALGGSLLILRGNQPDTKAMKSYNPAFDPCQPAKSEFDLNALITKDSNTTSSKDNDNALGELYLKTILAVLIVLVLGIAAIYVSKKLLPKITNLPGKEIHIVETVHLGQRKAIHLLEIGNRRILIGSTNETISSLAELNPTFMDLSSTETDINFGKTDEK
ncbi:MAG: FliO/MopB family protein [Sedimentisphaerales bacterium]|nr:FliO/MopB family protein [Sedimentisphaerales bacterium]